jgi:hypothetical protein
MDVRRFLHLAFAVLVTGGLALAPFARPAAAHPQSAGMGMSMSADMPCCPDKQTSKDCQDCPLVAMCVLKTVQAGASVSDALPLRERDVAPIALMLDAAARAGTSLAARGPMAARGDPPNNDKTLCSFERERPAGEIAA